MAPEFKINMFKIWERKNHIEFLICFTAAISLEDLFKFRDLLIKIVDKKNTLKALKDEGDPTPRDSACWLFESKDFEQVNNLREGTKNTNEEPLKRVCDLSVFYLETSHDHPCLEGRSKMLTKPEMMREIEDVSSQLKIEMIYNDELPEINAIIRSNLFIRLDDKTKNGTGAPTRKQDEVILVRFCAMIVGFVATFAAVMICTLLFFLDPYGVVLVFFLPIAIFGGCFVAAKLINFTDAAQNSQYWRSYRMLIVGAFTAMIMGFMYLYIYFRFI